MESQELLEQQLQDLLKQLGKKQNFENAVSSINSLLRDRYPSAPPLLRKSFYAAVCRVATILKTRHTSPGFWLAGLRLFEEAETLTPNSSEKEYLKSCIAQAKEHLELGEIPPVASDSSLRSTDRGYLFEGHLTVDPEPPLPPWLVRSNLMSSLSSLMEESSSNPEYDGVRAERATNLLEELVNNLDDHIPEELMAIVESQTANLEPRAPPASKEVVANLPIITLTEEILSKLGPDAECAICKENLVVDDKMQELPCKHTFHPPCLKPWLDVHNSCPICRHELKTDDHFYESWKEREKEAEEERKGAANALRGGEFMYV
ncbi:hypothetical protein K2173_015891 [Erythroxylum novogranatense]|uniref:RING-type E3 ubiquitin transferase n=1 Tax=Erythroxylum novogranatense TaxID=1862640 RepID=A0AAV8SF94_9ROSI|nr:hypothetical protein K2173_015891 [Erythroxylum novogranatense]